MFKSIYDFTKVFSFLFLISGFFFIFKEAYITAFFMMISFFIIRVADSDYAFEILNLKNHAGFVVTLTFIFIFINGILLVHEMTYSPYFYQFSSAQQDTYVKYEDELFNTMKPCLDYHNYMMKVVNQNLPVNAEYEEQSNKICSDVIQKIEDIQVPDEMDGIIKKFSLELKEDFRTLSINLSKFHYAEKNSTYTITKVKEANTNIINNITKIRKIMSIPQNLNEDKRNFITL